MKRDAAYVDTCLKAPQSGMLSLSNADRACARNGFSNWKNAMEKEKGFKSTIRLIRTWRQLQDMSWHPQQ